MKSDNLLDENANTFDKQGSQILISEIDAYVRILKVFALKYQNDENMDCFLYLINHISKLVGKLYIELDGFEAFEKMVR